MLLVYIVLSVQPSKPIKEGMLDYFTVEQYLKTIPTTQGQYVRIRPSTISGDGKLTISQIQVIDMNGNNIALNMPTFSSSTAAGSAPSSVTVDGTLDPRIGMAKVWTTSGAGQSQYWQVDLGSVQQISQVIYTGEGTTRTIGVSEQVYATSLTATALRSRGMTCDILAADMMTVNATMTFPYTDSTQTLTFPNSINITPTPSDTSIGVMNPLLIPLNTPQPEVYLVTGNYTKQQLDLTCGLLGATVATTGQVSNAKFSGAQWSVPGWTLSRATPKEYILNNPTVTEIITTTSNNNTQAAVNCFGIKSARGTASTVTAFSPNRWSQYDDANVPAYYGGTRMEVPDVTKLYDFVRTTFIPSTITRLNNSITAQIPNLPEPECIIPPGQGMNVLGFNVGDKVCGRTITEKFNANKTYTISELDAELTNVFNPNSCRQKGPRGIDPICSVSTPPESFIYRYGSYANATLYSALEYAPWNLILDDGTSPVSSIHSNIDIFGVRSEQARIEMEASLELCSKIFLGSDQDVQYYINISYANLKPYIRADNGYAKFCKQEIRQSVEKGDYVFKVVSENQTSNRANCNREFTSDMLGLLPSPTRDYAQIWIYNRIIRFIQYKLDSKPPSLTQADLNNLGLTNLTPASSPSLIKNSVRKMRPTVGGLSIPIDVTNNYILDKIAQAFYEGMGGNYIMSQIYDVFTIGGTIMDIRFDMTKHADISVIQAKIADLRAKYYAIRSSTHMSQDILDQAKSDYESGVATLQAEQSINTLPPVIGVVGRFFYTYSTDTTAFTITGFSLDSRAVTSFIPELNGGIQVATGGAAGAINYIPTVLYTKNIPEALPCRDEQTLRKIMDDYVDLTQTDLQSMLLGTVQSNGKTYTGLAGGPSINTKLGTLRVDQVIGAIQISPTQCAVSWKETLWNDASNVPVASELTNISRNAVFSYVVNTEDWYANTINIDPSGITFYSTPNVPACVFDTVAWQNVATPRLDTASVGDIKKDFIANGWNNGFGLICPNTIPNYIFNAADYIAASRWQLNSWYNNGGSGPLDVAATKQYYLDWGINGGDYIVRAAEAITPLSSPIVIQKPLPPNNTLDDLEGVCPSTTCEDLNVLYSLADQYNNDPSSAGSIIRIKRAYTASPYQCDVEADINYDVKGKNGAGKTVVKGSFTYNENGTEIPCIGKGCPPADLNSKKWIKTDGFQHAWGDIASAALTVEEAKTRCIATLGCNQFAYTGGVAYFKNIPPTNTREMTEYPWGPLSTYAVSTTSPVYTDVKIALFVSTNIDDCTFSYGGTDGRDSGTTIQSNTPKLYKPMEYISFLTDINLPSLTSSFDSINTAISDAANNTVSVLTSYRDNTVAAVSNIATLGTGCTTKCTDTAVMNNMLAYYKSRVNRATQINTVLRMGTLNSTTCDMTYQEDTLTPSGTGYRIVSSQTAGMRFTLAPDTGSCTFKTTAMTSILPAAPSSVALDLKQTPSSAACKEVYGINSTTLTQENAVAKCISYGGVLATEKQLKDAAAAGASWSVPGYVVDVSGSIFSPTGTQLTTVAKRPGGAACYGVKPTSGKYTDVLPFSGNQWNQPGACATSINYVNPGKEAFMNYGTPVQVTESTFPLNTKSFGLDMARNRGGPDIDTLYEEPLRAPDRPSDVYGPKDVADDSLLQPEKAQSFRYIRFRPVKTRDPANPTVDVGKFRFLLGQSEVDLRSAKAANPMGSWVGDIEDLVGDGFRRGFSDVHKRALVFGFPYAMLINGFTWTTANPDKGVGGDPVQWKLEGSQNGTYWTTLRDQTKHNYPVPLERYQELPVFRF